MDDDDDEFGELYADVLRPIAVAPTLPPVPILPPAAADPAHDLGGGVEDEISSGGSGCAPAGGTPSNSRENLDPSAPPAADDSRDDDWMLGRAPPVVDPANNWGDEEDTAPPQPQEVGARCVAQAIESRVLKNDEQALRVPGSLDEDGATGEAEAFSASKEAGHRFFGGGAVENSGDLDEAPVIPGLSAGRDPSGALLDVKDESRKPLRSEDWDSDSDDDLQIVLNDNNHLPFGVEKSARIEIDDEDDEEEDLVIVTDKDQHPLSAVEGQDWGEETVQPISDGERNEIMDAAKEASATGAAPGTRIGLNNHGFQAQHHSVYKYIRPGAVPLPGLPGPGTAAPSGAARLPGFSGGRGDWRPSGGRGIPNAPKGYHTGFGSPAWPNSSARAFGSGLDFSLPAHKIIFDIDIESFEEKPWRRPGVVISDFFNFELDEDKWKDYCKQLDQHRLESTMQSKIHVYESGRSEQGYDPDLPPELAAAAGRHDISADSRHGKTDNGESHFASQGKGPAVMRAPLPIGRAIQVECGYRERLPSIDTRPPRYRDSDSIIEIVMRGSFDDLQTYNCSPELHEIPKGEDNKAFNETEKDDGATLIGFINQHPHASSSQSKDMTRTMASRKEKDDALHLPSESFAEYHEDSRTRRPESPAGASEDHHIGRLSQGSPHKRDSSSLEQSIGSIRTRSVHSSRFDDQQQEAQEDSNEVNQSSQISPIVADGTETELHIEEKYSEHDEKLTLLDGAEIEGKEMSSELRPSNQTDGDANLVHSDNKKKLGSRVVQLAVDDGGGEDEWQTWSSGTSREKSGSSKDYSKLIENGEVIQERGSQAGNTTRTQKEDEGCLRKKDECTLNARQDVEKDQIASKGREVASDSNQRPPLGRSYERRKESESSNSSWQRRDDNLHNRRSKDDTRRENSDEMASRHKNRNQTDDRSRKHVEGKERRGCNRDKVLGKRERDDSTMSRSANIDDPVMKRKRDEDFLRGKADKVDAWHGHRDREDFGRRKRERDDDLDSRRKEVDARTRDKTEDHLPSKHKDDIWHYREREDRQKLKSHESAVVHREREGQRAPRGGRGVEDKPLDSNGRNRNDLTTNYDKDYREKERKRHNEHLRKDRARDDNVSQQKGQGDASVREKHSVTDERKSRRERLNTYSDCAPSAASQYMYRERHRDNARKTKDAEAHKQNSQGLGKRKHEDHRTAHSNEKVYNRGLSEQESKNISSKMLSKKEPHRIHEQHEKLQQNSMKQEEPDPASDDEKQSSRKGRSKLERWTSHQERDYDVTDDANTSNSSKPKNIEGSVDVEQADELAKAELNCSTVELDGKVADEGQVLDKTVDKQERHLDTMAKLKRRSERFKLPMPKEKEIATSKTLENDAQLPKTDAVLDSEVKPERPARKRRWTGS